MKITAGAMQFQPALRFQAADMKVLISQVKNTLNVTGPFLTNGDGESFETPHTFKVEIGGKPYKAEVYKAGPKKEYNFTLSSLEPAGVEIRLQQNEDWWDTMYELSYSNSAKSNQNNTSMDNDVLAMAKEILAKLRDFGKFPDDKRFDL